jgi:hypothetical protein
MNKIRVIQNSFGRGREAGALHRQHSATIQTRKIEIPTALSPRPNPKQLTHFRPDHPKLNRGRGFCDRRRSAGKRDAGPAPERRARRGVDTRSLELLILHARDADARPHRPATRPARDADPGPARATRPPPCVPRGTAGGRRPPGPAAARNPSSRRPPPPPPPAPSWSRPRGPIRHRYASFLPCINPPRLSCTPRPPPSRSRARARSSPRD